MSNVKKQLCRTVTLAEIDKLHDDAYGLGYEAGKKRGYDMGLAVGLVDGKAAGIQQGKKELDEVIDILDDVIDQACYGKDNELDSCALSAFARGMRKLAEYNKIKIKHEVGRRIIASRVEPELAKENKEG
jgi:hypothetical protein